MATYRDLIAWQKAMSLAEGVYAITRAFPKEEQFGLTSQLRRAGVSVPSNIAEGHGRLSVSEFDRFLRIALGSVREVETQLILSGRLRYATSDLIEALVHDAEEVGRIINGLLRCHRDDGNS
jgi:four helix bundle protein